MAGRDLLHGGKVGRHEGSYYTKPEASMAGTGSIESIGESGGEISTRVEGTITRVTGDRMSLENGGTCGSPYASRDPSKHHEENFP